VYKINSCPIKVSKNELGTEFKSPVHDLQRSNFTTYEIWRTSWIKALEKEHNRTIYNSVQRIINIKIAKAYRTTPNEALCALTGITPIVINAEEEAKMFNIMRGSNQNETDKDKKATSSGIG
jgi:hypothetical protein